MAEHSKATHALPFFGKGKVYWSSYTYGPHSEALLEEGGTFSGQRLGETPVKAHLSRWLTDFSAYTPPQNMAVIIRDVYLWIHYILKGFFLVPSIVNYMTSMRPIRTQNLIIYEHPDVKKKMTLSTDIAASIQSFSL